MRVSVSSVVALAMLCRDAVRMYWLAWVAVGLLGGATVGYAQQPASERVAEPTTQPDRVELIVVVGAAGEPEYAEMFETWAERWRSTGQHEGWSITTIGAEANSMGADADATELGEAAESRELLRQAIEDCEDASRVWIVLLGHGTFTAGKANFNLVGSDVSSEELASWAATVSGELILVNCSSASAPFLPELSGPKRMVITATRSGAEVNFSRFGGYLSKAILDTTADIDHDEEVSLLEAFLAASRRTEEYYIQTARLAAEHALLDDNGDSVGSEAGFFAGTRAVKASKGGVEIDGGLASRLIVRSSEKARLFTPELAKQRLAIETKLDSLRRQKTLLVEEDYWAELERLLLELAAIYEVAEGQEPQSADAATAGSR